MEFLRQEWFGNSASAWLIALLLAVVAPFLLRIVVRVALKNVRSLASHTDTFWDDVLGTVQVGHFDVSARVDRPCTMRVWACSEGGRGRLWQGRRRSRGHLGRSEAITGPYRGVPGDSEADSTGAGERALGSVKRIAPRRPRQRTPQ